MHGLLAMRAAMRLIIALMLNPSLPLIMQEVVREPPSLPQVSGSPGNGIHLVGTACASTALLRCRHAWHRPLGTIRAAQSLAKHQQTTNLPLLGAVAASALVRGMLLPFTLLVAAERGSWRALASRTFSGFALGALALCLSTVRALQFALFASLCAALCGFAGGMADSFSALTASTLMSAMSYAALPLAQTKALEGAKNMAQIARRVGGLSIIDAFASSAGVQVSLGSTRWAAGGAPSVIMCAAAAAIAGLGLGFLVWFPRVEVGHDSHLAAVSQRVNARHAAEMVEMDVPASRQQMFPASYLLTLSLALATIVAMPSTILQHEAEQLLLPPSALDRLMDAVLRAVAQAAFVPLVIDVGGSALGLKLLAVGGCFLVVAGAIFSALAQGISSRGARVSVDAMPLRLQRSMHHLMTFGQYVTETASTSLVAIGATVSGLPSSASARCAFSLVLLHMGITLGPALLPICDWFIGHGICARIAQLLLPIIVMTLVGSIPPVLYPKRTGRKLRQWIYRKRSSAAL